MIITSSHKPLHYIDEGKATDDKAPTDKQSPRGNTRRQYITAPNLSQDIRTPGAPQKDIRTPSN